MVRYVRFLFDWPKSSFHVPHPSCRHDGRKDGSPIVSFAITPSLLLKGSRDSRGFARLLPSFVCRQGTLCPAGAPQLAITGAGWGREQVEHWHGGRRRSGAGRPRGGVCISVQRYSSSICTVLHGRPQQFPARACVELRTLRGRPSKTQGEPDGPLVGAGSAANVGADGRSAGAGAGAGQRRPVARRVAAAGGRGVRAAELRAGPRRA